MYNDLEMNKAKIITNPNILGGKPVIAGTRISVELIMNFLATGMTVDEILSEYTELKKSEVLAAINYAARSVSKRPTKDSNIETILPQTQ